MAFQCNNDLYVAAMEFLKDAREIADEEPMAASRRAVLYRAAAHSLLSLAELTSLPVVTKCNVCDGMDHIVPCSKCGGVGYLVTP